MTSPDNQNINYTYDADNRITAISNATGNYVFTYDAAGRRTKLTYPNATSATYTYDNNGNLTKVAHAKGKTAITSVSYTYDKVKNRLKITDKAAVTYTYDDIYRLKTSSKGGAFTYDPVGNRTTGPASQTYSYDYGNELITTNSAYYNYDANGNLTRKTEGSIITDYTLDDANRLIQVTKTGGTIITYTYDPFGRRILKTVSPSGGGAGEETTYVYDNQNIIAEYDQSRNIKAKYTH